MGDEAATAGEAAPDRAGEVSAEAILNLPREMMNCRKKKKLKLDVKGLFQLMTCAFRPLPLPPSLLSLIHQYCLDYGCSATTARRFTARNAPYALSRRQSSSFAVSRSKSHRDGWQPVIGLELHVQLKSPIKLFSSAPTSFDEIPNTQVAFFDAAIPGSLPVLNPEPVKLALRAAIAFGCNIRRKSKYVSFDCEDTAGLTSILA
jgi:hypothetical protein